MSIAQSLPVPDQEAVAAAGSPGPALVPEGPFLGRVSVHLESSPKSFLLRVAEILTVVTAIGFVLSSLANSAVFSYWGLSFLAVAGTADVLFSGFTLAGMLLAFLLSLVVVAWYNSQPSRLGDFCNWATALGGLASFAVLLYRAYRMLVAVHWPPSFPHHPPLQLATPIVMLLTLMVARGIGLLARQTNLSVLQTMKAVFLEKGVIVGETKASTQELRYFGGALLFWCFVWLIPTAAEGYMAAPTQVLHDSTDPSFADCAQFNVLWVGQSSIVGRCSNRPEETRVVGRSDKRVLVAKKSR